MNSNELTADEKKKAKEDFLNEACAISRYKFEQHISTERAIFVKKQIEFPAYRAEADAKGYKAELIGQKLKFLLLTDKETGEKIQISGRKIKRQSTQQQDTSHKTHREVDTKSLLNNGSTAFIPFSSASPVQPVFSIDNQLVGYLAMLGQQPVASYQAALPIQTTYNNYYSNNYYSNNYYSSPSLPVQVQYPFPYYYPYANYGGLMLNASLKNTNNQTANTQTVTQNNKHHLTIPRPEPVSRKSQKTSTFSSPAMLFNQGQQHDKEEKEENLNEAPLTASTSGRAVNNSSNVSVGNVGLWSHAESKVPDSSNNLYIPVSEEEALYFDETDLHFSL